MQIICLAYFFVTEEFYPLPVRTIFTPNKFSKVCYCEGDLCNKNGIKGIDDDSVHFPDYNGGAIVFPGNVNQGNNGTNGTDTTSAAAE